MNTITLTKSQRKLSPKRILQYGVLVAVAYFAFQFFDSITKNRQVEHFYDDIVNDQKIVENNDFDAGGEQFDYGKNMDVNMDVQEIAENERQKAKHRKKTKKHKDETLLADNVNELNKMVADDIQLKKQLAKGKESVKKDEELEEIKDEIAVDIDKPKGRKGEKPKQIISGKRGQNRPEFETGEDTPDMIREKQRRRMEFFNTMGEMNGDFDEQKESDFHEDIELLSFVTAAWSKTFKDVVNLVVSIQNHYVTARIVIYDIGLEKEQKEWLASLCQVQVKMSLIEVWPAHIKDLERKLWRPIIIQMAMAHISHLIWIEPNLVITKQKIGAYIEHSRKIGIVIAGNRQKYSTFVVTHPDMYYYLSSDVRKLMRVPHFEINMIILHNTNTIQQKLMKWMLACTMEEWCIAPVGTKQNCDTQPMPNAKYYSNCHKFDESAINILLKTWMKYDLDKFSLRDIVTRKNDGRDAKVRARICNSARKAGDL